SIHDVMPAYAAELRRLLADLDAIGARPRVLKVVPHAADGGPLAGAPGLVALLRAEVRAGSEVVLHGYAHRAAGPYRGPWPARWRARLFAGDAAEFLTLDRAALAARLEDGRRELRDLGFDPRGFCAPSWLASPELAATLRGLDFRYSVGLAALHDLRCGRRRWLPWAGYMGAGPRQERLIHLVGAALLAATPRAPVVKVFLHPQGVPDAAAYGRTLRLLARLVREREPVTYGQLLDN
ncbi:MAG TPA: DUF2334 domain-containing protein, partial [Thermomicrobiales bacterium]|nr:DUF2334 domain-containing protein [Thermomicrobiales bacterium]